MDRMNINDEGWIGWIWMLIGGKIDGYEWCEMDRMDMNEEGWMGWIWMIKDGLGGYEWWRMDGMD